MVGRCLQADNYALKLKLRLIVVIGITGMTFCTIMRERLNFQTEICIVLKYKSYGNLSAYCNLKYFIN